MNITAIIHRIESIHSQITHLYKNSPGSALLEPNLPNGHSVKDVLAHIAAWEWRCAGMLDLAHETNMPFRANPDVEALNQEFYQDRQGWSWEEVEHDFCEAHEALLQAIHDLPAERLNDGTIQKTIAEETWEHYEKHLVELQKWHQRLISQWVRP